MKIEKLSLNGIKNMLSRTELKKIMAGSGGGCVGGCGGNNTCCACEIDVYEGPPPPPPPYFLFCNTTDCNGACESIGYGASAGVVDCSYC